MAGDDLRSWPIRKGTVFPSPAVAGDRFKRTDIKGGMIFEYDGTRWLSEQLFMIQFGNQDVSAATVAGPGYGWDPTGMDVYIQRMECTGRVSGGTHNGSNHWLYRLYSNNVGGAGGGDNLLHSSLTTFAQSATTMQNLTNGNINTVLDVSVANSVIIVAEEVGASGTFRGYGHVECRYIGT